MAYSKGVTARVVCLVALAAAVARAQPETRRQVAVIDLTTDDQAKKLREDLYNALVKHWALAPAQNTFDRDFEGPFLDEDAPIVEAAAQDAHEAEDALAQGELKRARVKARDGLDKLTSAGPTAGSALRADLAFALGVADLMARDKKASAAAFALAARLDPLRRLDPGRYMDDIVRAFEAAKAAPAAKVALVVSGNGHVWVDGLLVGTAPSTFEVTVGLHIVQVADFGLETRGAVVETPSSAVTIADAKAPDELKVRRARASLARAPDRIALAGTLRGLADLVGVHDAVLITKQDGKLFVQTVTWREDLPVFSKEREVAGASPEELLEPLSGPKPPDEVREPPRAPIKPRTDPVPPREGEPKWYRKPWVLPVAIAGGVIAIAVPVILVVGQHRYVTPPMKAEFPQ